MKVEVVPQRGGFARHAFYSTGSAHDQLIAFWDLANAGIEGELHRLTTSSRQLR